VIIIAAVVVLFTLLLLGLPIAFGLGVVAFVGIWIILGLAPAGAMVAQVAFDTLQSYDLVVLPLFLMMGNFIARAGLAHDLYAASNAFVGHRRGGLAMATVLACAGFSAVCGSSMATAATMGQVTIPSMRKFGYSDELAAGSVAAGGTLGNLIPPGVLTVLYGLMTNTSIGALYIGSLLPSVVIVIAFMAAIAIVCRLNPALGPAGPRSTWAQRLRALWNVWAILLLFAVVLGGIYGGIFTATEAAGIGAAGAFVSALASRRMSWPDFAQAMRDSVRTSALMFILLVGAVLFNNLMELGGFTQLLKDWIIGLDVNRWAVMGVIVVIYLILGCPLDSLSMILLTVPIFFPIVTALGFDPVWFGIVVIITAEIGLITPPIGLNVQVLSTLFKDIDTRTAYRGVMPFLIAEIIGLGVVVAFPAIATVLPSMMK
jgi:C4-dicarboxylate transporter, DctM subunit